MNNFVPLDCHKDDEVVWRTFPSEMLSSREKIKIHIDSTFSKREQQRFILYHHFYLYELYGNLKWGGRYAMSMGGNGNIIKQILEEPDTSVDALIRHHWAYLNLEFSRNKYIKKVLGLL